MTTHVARHLMAAHGYLELGLPLEAWEELEGIDAPHQRSEVSIMGMQVAVLQALERWGPMAEACGHLTQIEPGEPGWVVSQAYATRRAESIPAARDLLLKAMVRFPAEAIISFNLACYAAQVGDLEDAKDCLRRAFALQAGLRAQASSDPDLEPIWPALGQL